jgi:hypothetical protein
MKKHHNETQILGILREAEQGKPLPDLLRAHGISSWAYSYLAFKRGARIITGVSGENSAGSA